MIPLKVAPDNGNWGDILSPVLIKKLTGIDMPVVYGNTHRKQAHLLAIGSLLRWANKNTTVWGTGFLSNSMKVKGRPHICAVRGPSTRERLQQLGIDCPEIYGDPALLYPRFYNPKVETKFDLGIIPHYCEKDLYKHLNQNGVLTIDICAGIDSVVDQVKSCKKIISSSLHGLIVADAYQIPSLWIEASSEVLGKGFKFIDYFRSVGRSDRSSFKVNKETTLELIENQFSQYKIDIDLDKLANSFPIHLLEK